MLSGQVNDLSVKKLTVPCMYVIQLRADAQKRVPRTDNGGLHDYVMVLSQPPST